MKPPRHLANSSISLNILSRLRDRFRSAPPTLEELLERASRTKRGREDFYRALLESTLHLPGEQDAEGVYIRPYDLDGKVTIFLFSTEAKLAARLGRNTGSIALPGEVLFPLLPPFDRLLLDDGSKYEKEFTRSEVAALADGSITTLAGDEGGGCATSVLGQPRHYPVALMEELKRALALRPEIDAAYIAQLQESATATPRIVIAFETTMDDESFALLCSRAEMLAVAVGVPDVIFTRLSDDALGQYLRSESEAFYRRN